MNCPQSVPDGGGIDRGKLLEMRAQIMKQKTEQVSRSLERRQGAKMARQSFLESRRAEAAWQWEWDRARTEAAMAEEGQPGQAGGGHQAEAQRLP